MLSFGKTVPSNKNLFPEAANDKFFCELLVEPVEQIK